MTEKHLSLDAIILIAERFKVLSEAVRLQILISLQEGDKSVNELAEIVETSQPNVSKHLKMLRKAGILKRKQTGTTVYYSIMDETIIALCDMVCGSFKEQLNNDRAMISAL